MTAPGAPMPDGAYVVGDGKGYGQGQDKGDGTEAHVRNQMRGGPLGGYENAQNTLKIVSDDIDGKIGQAVDKQVELSDRLELLEGVQGYCSTYLGLNWNITGQKRITLPFNTQLGPRKGVDLVGGNAVKLLSKGLWRADAHVSFMPPAPSWLGNATVNIEVYIKVYVLSSGVNGAAYSETRYDIAVNSVGPETAAFSKTFVIPSDGLYGVCVQVYQPKAQLIGLYGGTLRSALSVNKWDNGTINNVIADNVGNGGTLS